MTQSKLNDDSFLNIEDVDNKDQLILIRKMLFNSVVENSKREKVKGMYLISLAIFTEFERLTQHITNSEIIKQ